MISGSIRQSCPVCIGRFMGSAGSWTLVCRQMAQLHQRPRSDPRHPQPLPIRNAGYLPNRGVAFLELAQDYCSYRLRKLVQGERIIQLHLALLWPMDKATTVPRNLDRNRSLRG
jgi:hypothetical protein